LPTRAGFGSIGTLRGVETGLRPLAT
jgi:hypothetical protein